MQNANTGTGKLPWSAEEAELLEQVIQLIQARRDSGYPEDEEGEGDGDGNITVDVEDEGEDALGSYGFADCLVEELQEILDNGKTFMTYAIAEAKGNVSGMMGL